MLLFLIRIFSVKLGRSFIIAEDLLAKSISFQYLEN